MESEALRIILGCTKTTGVLGMQKELDIPGVDDGILEINLMTGLKLLLVVQTMLSS